MENGAFTIHNARDLIDRYYRVHLDIPAPTKYLNSEVEYAEQLLRRYSAGPQFVDDLISKAVNRLGKDSLTKFTALKGDLHKHGAQAQADWYRKLESQKKGFEDVVDEARKEYKAARNVLVDNALTSKEIPSVILDDMRARSTAIAHSEIGDNKAFKNEELTNAMRGLWDSILKSNIDDKFQQMVAEHIGFLGEDDFVNQRLKTLGLDTPSNKNLAKESDGSKPALKKTIDYGNTAISANAKMATTPIKEKKGGLRHQIATQIKVEGHHYDPSSKKNYLLFSSPALKSNSPLILSIENKSAQYDSRKEYQPGIYDKRFVAKNPIGTKMIATLSLVGERKFVAAHARQSPYDISQGNFTMMQIDQPSAEFNSIQKRHIAMRWQSKTVDANQIYMLKERFSRPQNDLIKSSSSWWGYQLRVVENGAITRLSNVHAWEPKYGTSPIYDDLHQLVSRYNQVYKARPGTRIEVALCECVKVMPTVKPSKATMDAMINTPTLLVPGNYKQSQLGGQVLTRGLIEHQNHAKWGRTVVTSGFVMDMPTPNKQSNENHIQQHILDARGRKLTLNQDIAVSANGRTKEALSVNTPIYAEPQAINSSSLNFTEPTMGVN